MTSIRLSDLRAVATVAAILILALSRTLPAQTGLNTTPEDSLIIAGIRLTDAGEAERAREVFLKGAKLYPSNSTFVYEIAYIEYQEEHFAEAKRILDSIIALPDASDRYFQLLGNVQDILGDAPAAVRTYDEGLKRFPSSGPLHLERGVMAAQANDYEHALAYWEDGIRTHPQFPSNYYHAARVLILATSEPGWGVLYGETYLNMEPFAERAANTRAQLFKGWNDAITTIGENSKSRSDTAGSVSMFKTNVIYFDTTTHSFGMPFTMCFEMDLVKAALTTILSSKTTLSISDLHELRKRFMEEWFADTLASSQIDFELLDRWRKLENADLFEAYDYMIFNCPETEAEARAWRSGNPDGMDRLVDWMRAHEILKRPQRAFCRLNAPSAAIHTGGDEARK